MRSAMNDELDVAERKTNEWCRDILAGWHPEITIEK
jgi:hypothetical protein